MESEMVSADATHARRSHAVFAELSKREAKPETMDSRTWADFHTFRYEGVDCFHEGVGEVDGAFLNPILAGLYPDPSICRAGDDFVLVNSTFAYFPGIPVFRSRDLVNWRLIGHVLDRPSQCDGFKNIRSSEGAFAPAISYHKGRFYVVCTLVGSIGNFISWADDPAGPWSDPLVFKEIGGIDPSLFFDDDGRVYLVNNDGPPSGKPLYDGHRALWLREIDLKIAAVIGEPTMIVNGGVDLAKQPIWIEGPHLYKRDGQYLLIAAEGGTGPQHSQVAFRSRSIRGPYEPFKGGPLLTQRDLDGSRADPVTCVGHADLVDLPDGSTWAVFLGVRPYEDEHHNLGRETFLLPVEWRDGWPIILEKSSIVPRILPRPSLPATSEPVQPMTGTFEWADDFDAAQLDPRWMMLRQPESRWYDCGGRDASLRIKPRSVPLWSRGNPSFLCRRQQHNQFRATVTLRIDAQASDAECGLVAFQSEFHHYFLGVRVTNGGTKEIFLECVSGEAAGGAAVPLRRIVSSVTLMVSPGEVALRLEGNGASLRFSYHADPVSDWTPIGGDVDATNLSTHTAGGFLGVTLGMHARTIEL